MNWSKYYPGGAIYEAVEGEYGSYWANEIAGLADNYDLSGINSLLSDLRRGSNAADYSGSTSTFGNLWDQLTTDPLAAPLDSLNNQLGNAMRGVFRNPWVIVAIVLVIFLSLGGGDFLRRKLAAR